jgi:outer membrane protein assembly factor BamB
MSLQGEALSARDLTQWGHSLSVMGDSLYIISSPRKAFWEGASLMALDASSLTEIWRRELGSLRTYLQSPPAVSPKVVVAASDEKIWAFDRVSGTPLWTVNDEEDPDLFILGDEFFLSKDYRIESRDLMTGEVTRVYPGTSYGYREELVVSPGMLVAAHEGELLLFNLSEGL